MVCFVLGYKVFGLLLGFIELILGRFFELVEVGFAREVLGFGRGS